MKYQFPIVMTIVIFGIPLAWAQDSESIAESPTDIIKTNIGEYTFERFVEEIYQPKDNATFREFAFSLHYGGVDRYTALHEWEILRVFDELSAEEAWAELVTAAYNRNSVLKEHFAQTSPYLVQE